MPGKPAVAAAIACLIILHRPSGQEIAIDTRQIAVIEPVQTHHHYVYGTKTLVYVTGGEKVAVREEPHEVEYLTKICEDGAK